MRFGHVLTGKARIWPVKSLLSLGVALTLSYTNCVLADNAGLKNIERITTTGSRFAESDGGKSVVISRVGEEEIKLVSPAHIEEVLKFVAGAGVQRGNGQEYLPALRSQVFTGAGACGGLLTAEDGIPLRAAGFCNINELFEAHTEMAQRIEVLKGPGSALYGSNAVHGVINVITPDTTRDLGMIGMDYGAFGYKRAKLRQGKDLGNSGIGVNASVTRNSGYRDGEGVQQEKVNLRHRYESMDLTLTTGFTYTHLDQDTAGYVSGFESYKNEDLARSNENPDAFRENRAMRLWTNAKWELGDDRQLSVTPYLRNQNMDFRMHFLPGAPLEKNNQQGFGLQSLYRQPLSRNWRLDVGVDYEYTEGELQQFQDSPTQGSAFLVATVPEGQHYDYQVDATLLAPFVSLEWKQDAWTVTLGARYEYMNYDYTNNMIAGRTRDDGTECEFGGCRYSRPPSGNDHYSNISPKLGVSYQHTDNTLFYANLSQGYRAPQATELYRLQRDQQTADLKSETVTNAEVGVKGLLKKLSYVLSVYSMDKDNFIFRDSDFFNVNDGESRHRGIEAELRYQLSPSWDIAVAATYARHTYEHKQVLNDINIKGNDIDTAPRTMANARLGWNVSANGRVELEWLHVDEYYTDPENLHNYEGHDLLHLRASFRVTENLTMYARVLNLTDEAYAERADFSGFGGDRYFPGLPRHAMVSAEYQW